MKGHTLSFGQAPRSTSKHARMACYKTDAPTPAQLKAKEEADKAAFEEAIKDLPEAEQALMRTVQSQIKAAFDKQTEDNRKETADLLAEALGALKEQETIKAMAKVLEEQGMAIRKIGMQSNQEVVGTPRTFRESLKASLEAEQERIQAVVKAGGLKRNEEIELKVAVNITETTTIIAGDYENSLTQNTGIISPIRQRAERYLQAVTVGTIGNKYALWIEETTEDGTPIFIAEAAGKTQISVLYVEKRQDVQKIAVYSKVSTELMADLPQLMSFIERSMMKRVGIKIENELYSGAGTTVYLKGATNWATTFAAGSLANTVTGANEIDVFNAIGNQVDLAYGERNAVFVHPDTVAKIKTLKDDNGRPIWKEYVDFTIAGGVDALRIAGMRVIPTPFVTSGDFLGGDTKVLNVLFREALNIRMTPSGDDPINNLMTLIVESRLVQFASANEVGSLIKGDFATAIAALNTNA